MSLDTLIRAFEAFAETEYQVVYRCFRLAEPEDDSETDDDAVEAARDEATERLFVS